MIETHLVIGILVKDLMGEYLVDISCTYICMPTENNALTDETWELFYQLA
jgi:hypothetical protein